MMHSLWSRPTVRRSCGAALRVLAAALCAGAIIAHGAIGHSEAQTRPKGGSIPKDSPAPKGGGPAPKSAQAPKGTPAPKGAPAAVPLRAGFALPPADETRFVPNEVILDVPASV